MNGYNKLIICLLNDVFDLHSDVGVLSCSGPIIVCTPGTDHLFHKIQQHE